MRKIMFSAQFYGINKWLEYLQESKEENKDKN